MIRVNEDFKLEIYCLEMNYIQKIIIIIILIFAYSSYLYYKIMLQVIWGEKYY